MAWAGGHPHIADYSDGKELTTAERIDLFMQVCQTIQQAQQKGIIHRDLNPLNILVTRHDGIPDCDRPLHPWRPRFSFLTPEDFSHAPQGSRVHHPRSRAPRSFLSTMNPPTTPQSELPGIGFLADVSSEHRAFLACFGKFLRMNNGDTLIKEGDSQESLYVILSGILHILSNADGRQVLLAAMKEGDSIGEINLFDPATASATAVARSSCLIWSLSRSELDAFQDADPTAAVPVLRGLLRQVSKRIRSMNEKLATVEAKSAMHNFWSTTEQ